MRNESGVKAWGRITVIVGALIACVGSGSAQAQVSATSDPFSLTFDENGHATINNGGVISTETGFTQLDPNTGRNALTYALPSAILGGTLDVLDPSGALSDALSFYNLNSQGYMAYYSTLPGTDLADTISNGYVPTSIASVTESGDSFVYFSGGTQGANNDYFGTSGPNSVPDGGSTLSLLSGAFAFAGVVRRKLRK
jgi:hypothetical protein